MSNLLLLFTVLMSSIEMTNNDMGASIKNTDSAETINMTHGEINAATVRILSQYLTTSSFFGICGILDMLYSINIALTLSAEAKEKWESIFPTINMKGNKISTEIFDNTVLKSKNFAVKRFKSKLNDTIIEEWQKSYNFTYHDISISPLEDLQKK